MRSVVPLILVVLFSLGPSAGHAQWAPNGVALTQASLDQLSPVSVPDGAGGAIVAWRSFTPNGDTDVYAQHLLSNGALDPGWPALGLALCTETSSQEEIAIVSDGAGGAIVTWSDPRNVNWNIFAQRVLAGGGVDPAWPVDGRVLCGAGGDQRTPSIAPDGAGGAIVTWRDERSGPSDIYAQHVRSTGVVDLAWPLNGRDLCTAAGNQQEPAIVSDGAGGAIVTWTDERAGTSDIYAQHVLATSAIDPTWPADGRALCVAGNAQLNPVIASDGAGGAIVAWADPRLLFENDIYAQRIRANGVVDPAWPANGRALCTAPDAQNLPRIVSDGAGGAIVAWEDVRPGNPDVYCQHVLPTGVVDGGWPSNGRAVSTTPQSEQQIEVASDGMGGVFLTWSDTRAGSPDVYLHHVLASGALDEIIPPNGRLLCFKGEDPFTTDQFHPTIVSDGDRGAIVAWEDHRVAFLGSYDIFAQRIYSCGEDASVARCRLDGDPVSTALNDQDAPVIATDGAGGAVIAWSDRRNPDGTSDLYAQRVLSTGAAHPAWPFNGRVLCSAANNQLDPAIVSDGAGGAIVAWCDLRNGHNQLVFVHHVLPNGTTDPAWNPAGRVLAATGANQLEPAIVSDGAGGAIVAWLDARNGALDVYAHHIRSTGVVDGAWPPLGAALCNAVNTQNAPAMVADGAGGAIVAWQDARSGTNYDLYAQRVLAGGVVDPSWPVDGRAVKIAANDQMNPAIIADGAHGAIVTWQDYRSGTDYDIFAQHVLSTGITDVAWPLDGRVLCGAANEQSTPTIVPDGAGGAIVSWQDARGGPMDIYAQRVLASGAVDPAWPLDGRALCTAADPQYLPRAVTDGAGGAIVTWYDFRGGSTSDIYAHHVSSAGVVDPAWPVNGRALCLALDDQYQEVIVSDGNGGAVVAWEDHRYGAANADLYAQRVTSGGLVLAVDSDPEPARFRMLAPFPNPLRHDRLTIEFDLPATRTVSAWVVDLAGRRVRPLTLERSFTPGRQSIVWDGRDAQGARLPAGVYFVHVRAGDQSDTRRIVLL